MIISLPFPNIFNLILKIVKNIFEIPVENLHTLRRGFSKWKFPVAILITLLLSICKNPKRLSENIICKQVLEFCNYKPTHTSNYYNPWKSFSSFNWKAAFCLDQVRKSNEKFIFCIFSLLLHWFSCTGVFFCVVHLRILTSSTVKFRLVVKVAYSQNKHVLQLC